MVELLLKKKGTELLCGKCGDLSWCAGRKAECRDQYGILRSTACLAAERKAKKLRAEIAALKANTWLTLLERMTPLLLPVINCTTMTNQYLEEVQAIYNKATAELKSADAEEADIETGS